MGFLERHYTGFFFPFMPSSCFSEDISVASPVFHTGRLCLWVPYAATLCYVHQYSKRRSCYQWKCWVLSFFSDVHSPSLWKVCLHAPRPLFTCLSPLSPSNQKTHNKKQHKSKWKLLSTKKVRHIKLLIFVMKVGCDSSSQKFSTGWNFTALKIFEHQKNYS